MLNIVLLLLLQSISLHSMESLEDAFFKEVNSEIDDSDEENYFYQEPPIKTLVKEFLSSYNIERPILTMTGMLAFFSDTKEIPTTIVQKVIEGNDKLIQEKSNNNYVSDMLTIKNDQKKVKEINEFIPTIITVLKECSQVPTGLSDDLEKGSKFFEQMWHCYWLYVIPNSAVFIDKNDSHKPTYTHNIILECPITDFTDSLCNEQKSFLSVFYLTRASNICNLFCDVKGDIIPKLKLFIKEKRLKYSENEIALYMKMLNYLKYNALEQCIKIKELKATSLNDNKIKSDADLIGQISNNWQLFWKNENAEIDKNEQFYQFKGALDKHLFDTMHAVALQNKIELQNTSRCLIL